MTRVYRSREQWLQLIELFHAGDMNPTNFCRSQQISLSSFYHWRKEFTSPEAEAEPQPLFVDITPSPSQAAAWDIELELGPSVVLRMRRSC